jgi:hypothetical protein
MFVPPGPGGTKAPGSTLAADVIFTFESETEARLSQEAAMAGEPLQTYIPAKTENIVRPTRLRKLFLANTETPP